MQQILDKYLDNSLISNIANRFNTPSVKIGLNRLLGSSKAFILSSLAIKLQRPFLFVFDNHVDAAYFYNDLKAIVGDDKVFILPTSLHRSFLTDEIRGIDTPNLLLRTEVISKIISGEADFIVSYPAALAEMVASAENIKSNSFDINVGDKVDIETLVEFLQEYKFQQVDFVFDPGQFAVRGGIVDIFSFDNEFPYRIEFFGDEVESIRIFDIGNQLSMSKLDKIRIVPDINTKNDGELVNFFNFLPDNFVIAINDLQILFDFIDNNSSRLFRLEDDYGNPIRVQYAEIEEFKKSILNFSLLELSNEPLLAEEVIDFDISPQPVLQKNFNLLADILREYQQRGYELFLLSSQSKQLKRIREILDSQEVGAKDIEFIPLHQTLHQGFIDNQLRLLVFTDHQIFGRFHRYQLKDERLRHKKENVFIEQLQALKPGDYVVHIDYGIGKFAGLTTINNNGVKQEAIRLVYRNNDSVFVPIHSLHKISKYKGKDAEEPKLSTLGTGAWQKLKEKAKKRVKDIAKDLIKLYAARMKEQGFAFSPDSYLQEELEASFMFEDTPDQAEATQAVKQDMEKPVPMDRLICGDVGFGKTEIAIRAAFKAVADNKQVAVLCPTTVLTLQHYKTFSERLKDFPVRVDFISRLKKPKEQKQTLKDLVEGKIDIIIGTHRLLSKDVKFKDLGLLIIDEEQKFGVAAKERLRQLRVNVDTLTLTATPIPRTLQFSLMGARDLSIIKTPPSNRRPVITELHTFNKEIIRKAVCYEINRDGQIFFVHNHIDTLPKMADYLRELCPEARIAIAHGRMKPTELEEIMSKFVDYEYDILLTTSIIENGLDIPNANTIIINNAHKFGLSDLHQLRGRVGRSSRQAFCYLLAPPRSSLTEQARRRLTTIEQFVELGSGFNIALQDLDIRGAGNLLGAEQSGYINEMGFDTFRRVLEEAILELKTEEFKEVFKQEVNQKDFRFVTDCQISTDLGLQIPSDYISDDTERLKMYHKLNSLSTEEELEHFREELEDRFGKVPEQVDELINVVRLRWLAMELAIEKIVLKNKVMLCYFVSDKNSAFYDSVVFQQIIQFISKNKQLEFKQKNDKLYLKFTNIDSVSAAMYQLRKMKVFIEMQNKQDDKN